MADEVPNNTTKSNTSYQQNVTIPQQAIFLVGTTARGTFETLTPFTNKLIQNIFIGDDYCIYSDNNMDNIYATGNNSSGSLGIGITQTDKQFNTDKPIGIGITQSKFIPIQYFTKNNIKISNIFTNIEGKNTFFQTKHINAQIYGCGYNLYGNLGIKNSDCSSIYEPILIPDLQTKHVIDIKSGNSYNIALCSSNKFPSLVWTVIKVWCNTSHSLLPKNIIELIILFWKLPNTVYSTTGTAGSGFTEGSTHLKGWNELKCDWNVIKIAIGRDISMFLESDGVVWSCGSRWSQTLGWGYQKLKDGGYIYDYNNNIPHTIPYFIDNEIKVIDIQCGMEHSVCLGANGKIYTWGWNSRRVCGFGNGIIKRIFEPMLVMGLEDYFIVEISVGKSHNYVKSKCGKNFMFGWNKYKQCLKFDGQEFVSYPHQIDHIVLEKCKAKEIIKVVCGQFHTNVTVRC
eukprot:164865_1